MLLLRVALAAAILAFSGCEVAPAYPTADLVIAPDGSFSLDGQPVREQDLVKALRDLRRRSPLVMLFIRTDGGLPHPRDKIVYDAAYRAGINTTGSGAYKEQEGAPTYGIRLSGLLFLGAFLLLAVLVGASLWRRRNPR